YVSLDKVNAIGQDKLKYFKDLDDDGFLVLLYRYTAPYLEKQLTVNRFAFNPWASARDALEFFRGAALDQVHNNVMSASLFLCDLLNDVKDVAEAIECLA